MPTALEAAAEFLENDEARDLLGLHKIRVNGEMMDRGGLAALLRAELIRQRSRPTETVTLVGVKGGAETVIGEINVPPRMRFCEALNGYPLDEESRDFALAAYDEAIQR